MKLNEPTLAISICRGNNYPTFIDPKAPLVKRAFARVCEAFDPDRCAFITITPKHGPKRTYSYNFASKMHQILIQTASGIAIYTASCLAMNIVSSDSSYVLLKFCLIGITTIAGGISLSASKGHLNYVGHNPNMRIDYAFEINLSDDEFNKLKNNLSAANKQKTCGYYAPVFNNCAHYAARTLKSVGVKHVGGLILTPTRLAQQLIRVSKP